MAKSRRINIVIKIILAALSVAAVVAAVAYFWPLLAPFGDEAYLRRTIDDAGVFGPLVFMIIHALQVIIAPIPGQVIGLVGGYAFGPWWGTIYAVAGSTLGFAVVLMLSRKLGRPFVERFVSAHILERFDYLTSRAGSMTFFLIFLLPGLPDDLIGFIAGLTKIRLRILLLASIAGRLPGYAVLSAVGHGLTRDNLNPVIGAGVVLVLLAGVAFWQRAWIREFVQHDDRLSWAKRQWLKYWRQILLATVLLSAIGVAVYEIAAWYVAR